MHGPDLSKRPTTVFPLVSLEVGQLTDRDPCSYVDLLIRQGSKSPSACFVSDDWMLFG